MSETKHPWCRDVARDEAVRRAEDAENWRRLEAGEVVQVGDEYQEQVWPKHPGGQRWHSVPGVCVGKPIDSGHLPHRRRVPSAPQHRDLPEALAALTRRVEGLETVAEAWRQRCEDEADAAAVTPQREAEPDLRAAVNADGLRTERVTLEITHSASDDSLPVLHWDWAKILSDGKAIYPRESVRVVEEAASIDLVAECDELIRERNEARAECEKRQRDCRSARDHCTRLAEERDAALDDADVLRARVAELERAYHSECDARAQAQRELSDLNDAIRDREAGEGQDNSYAAQCRDAAAARERADRMISAAAANAGGEQEPVAWFHKELHTCFMHPNGALKANCVPLYAAPPEPRGWLTEEEREAVQAARAHFALGCIPMDNTGWCRLHQRRQAAMTALLSRETPPRVKVPNDVPSHRRRDDQWITAIREAGGEVEE